MSTNSVPAPAPTTTNLHPTLDFPPGSVITADANGCHTTTTTTTLLDSIHHYRLDQIERIHYRLDQLDERLQILEANGGLLHRYPLDDQVEARLRRLENPPKARLNSWDSTSREGTRANREIMKARQLSGNFGTEEGFKRKGF